MNTFCRILLLSLLAISTPSIAAKTVIKNTNAVSKQVFSAYTQLNETKLNAAVSNSQKDIQIIQMRLDSQDKRLDDQSKFIGSQESRISDIGLYLTAFGLLLVTILTLLGLIIFFTVRGRAREEARISAEKWFTKKTADLEQQIQIFRERLSQQEQQFNTQIKTQAKPLPTATENTVEPAAEPTITEQPLPQANPVKSSSPIPVNVTTDWALNDIAENLFGKTEPEAEPKNSFEDWNDKGCDLLILAKEAWEETDLRTDYLTDAAVCFDAAFDNAVDDSDLSLALSNQAYTAALQEKPEGQVRSQLHKALSLGGETLYSNILKNLEINPIHLDSVFRTLLDSVWAEAQKTGWLGFTSMGRRP